MELAFQLQCTFNFCHLKYVMQLVSPNYDDLQLQKVHLSETQFFYNINYLTNRFHVAVRLFSNRSQMTSKCGKNKKVAHEAIAECVTDVLTTF